MSTNIHSAVPSERLNDQHLRSDIKSLRKHEWTIWIGMLKSLWFRFRFILCCHYILWSSCGGWELSGRAMSVIFFLASVRCNVSGHTWTESLDQIPPGLHYEVLLQAYQQHLLKESLEIRLNAQRRKSHALDVSASVSWVVEIKSSTLLEDSAENNLSRQPVFTLLLGQRPYPSIHLFSSASSSHSGQMSLHWVGWSTRELAKQSCVETVCVCMCVCVCVCMLWYSLNEFVLGQTEYGAVGQVRDEVFTAVSSHVPTTPQIQQSQSR